MNKTNIFLSGLLVALLLNAWLMFGAIDEYQKYNDKIEAGGCTEYVKLVCGPRAKINASIFNYSTGNTTLNLSGYAFLLNESP